MIKKFKTINKKDGENDGDITKIYIKPPEPIVCYWCGGTGMIDSDPNGPFTCSMCEGLGEIYTDER